MALLARLALVRLAVETAVRRDLAAEILVAVEAQPRDDLLAGLVTLRAVVVAVDVARAPIASGPGDSSCACATFATSSTMSDEPLHAKIQRYP